MINNEVYQFIYDQIAPFLPEKWEKLVCYLEYGESSYTVSFFVRIDGKYINCFDLPSASEDKLYGAFDAIDEVVMVERNKQKEKLWTNMTICVDEDGKMHTDFDYTDLSESAYEHEQEWKEKYLK